MLPSLTLGLSLLAAGVGPRMTDAEFFGGMDLRCPGLEGVASATRQQAWVVARAALPAPVLEPRVKTHVRAERSVR